MEIGAAFGQTAYSQTGELESDMPATHITRAAGYDPVAGAKFFARPASEALGRRSDYSLCPAFFTDTGRFWKPRRGLAISVV